MNKSMNTSRFGLKYCWWLVRGKGSKRIGIIHGISFQNIKGLVAPEWGRKEPQ